MTKTTKHLRYSFMHKRLAVAGHSKKLRADYTGKFGPGMKFSPVDQVGKSPDEEFQAETEIGRKPRQ